MLVREEGGAEGERRSAGGVSAERGSAGEGPERACEEGAAGHGGGGGGPASARQCQERIGRGERAERQARTRAGVIWRAEELKERNELGELAVERAQQSCDAVEGERSDVPFRGVMARREADDEPGEEDAGGGPGRRVERRRRQGGADEERCCCRDDERAVCSERGSALGVTGRRGGEEEGRGEEGDAHGAQYVPKSPVLRFSRNSTSVCARPSAVRDVEMSCWADGLRRAAVASRRSDISRPSLQSWNDPAQRRERHEGQQEALPDFGEPERTVDARTPLAAGGACRSSAPGRRRRAGGRSRSSAESS